MKELCVASKLPTTESADCIPEKSSHYVLKVSRGLSALKYHWDGYSVSALDRELLALASEAIALRQLQYLTIILPKLGGPRYGTAFDCKSGSVFTGLKFLEITESLANLEWITQFAKSIPTLQGLYLVPHTHKFSFAIDAEVLIFLQGTRLRDRVWSRFYMSLALASVMSHHRATLLHYNCMVGSLDEIKQLFESGRFLHSINARWEPERVASMTPLLAAVACRHQEVVRYLIEVQKADMTITFLLKVNGEELDALDLAAARHDPDMLKLLWRLYPRELLTVEKVYKLFRYCNDASISCLYAGDAEDEPRREHSLWKFSTQRRVDTFHALVDIVTNQLKMSLKDIIDPKTGRSLIFTGFFLDALDCFIQSGMSVYERDHGGHTVFATIFRYYNASTGYERVADGYRSGARLRLLGYPLPTEPDTEDMVACVSFICDSLPAVEAAKKLRDEIVEVVLNFASRHDIQSNPRMISAAFRLCDNGNVELLRRVLEMGAQMNPYLFSNEFKSRGRCSLHRRRPTTPRKRLS